MLRFRSSAIEIKTPQEIEAMRVVGKMAAETLELVDAFDVRVRWPKCGRCHDWSELNGRLVKKPRPNRGPVCPRRRSGARHAIDS